MGFVIAGVFTRTRRNFAMLKTELGSFPVGTSNCAFKERRSPERRLCVLDGCKPPLLEMWRTELYGVEIISTLTMWDEPLMCASRFTAGEQKLTWTAKNHATKSQQTLSRRGRAGRSYQGLQS